MCDEGEASSFKLIIFDRISSVKKPNQNTTLLLMFRKEVSIGINALMTSYTSKHNCIYLQIKLT